jgi:hypothetical protein
MDLTLFDIALMPLIVAIVQVAKNLGMPTKWAPLLTGLLAIGGYILSQQVIINPAIAPIVEYWLNVLLVFLGATGIYGIGKWSIEQLTGPKPGSAAAYKAAVEDMPQDRDW